VVDFTTLKVYAGDVNFDPDSNRQLERFDSRVNGNMQLQLLPF
jgi:hypothetical protein